MTCSHCCDANNFFDTKNAEKELKKYLKKGAAGTTIKLIKSLEQVDFSDKTLLDIGGGIGMLQWNFLQNGGSLITDIDASKGYLAIAKKYAEENDWSNKTTFIEGDFNDHASDLTSFNIVTLDRVVCCYPDYKKILTNAAAKSTEYLALSYPISNWFSIAFNKMGRLYFLLKKSAFKTYIHPSKQIKSLLYSNGFEEVHASIKFPWNIQLYKRIAS